jgi:hypothetical protein
MGETNTVQKNSINANAAGRKRSALAPVLIAPAATEQVGEAVVSRHESALVDQAQSSAARCGQH